MKKHPIWFLVIGIAFLVIPATVYLIFLIPQLKEEYITLVSSAGIIGGAGVYAVEKIPDKFKYGSLFKTAARSFDAMVVLILIQDFIGQLLGLLAMIIVSFIIFKIFVEVWKDAKQRKQNAELAKEIARSIDETSK